MVVAGKVSLLTSDQTPWSLKENNEMDYKQKQKKVFDLLSVKLCS